MNHLKINIIKHNKLTTYHTFISLLLFFLATNAMAAMTGSGDVYSETFQGSRERQYKVYVPKSYDGNNAVPMIMALHGCVMNNTDALDLWNFDLIADQNNVILVLPYVTTFSEMRSDDCWGYWFNNHITEGGGGEVDDLYGLAQQVESNYNIDPTRRYITGISSGGAMTVAAAISYNNYWAAAAPVAGLAYGDWSSSVTSDLFQDLQTHIDKINAELNFDRAVPSLVIQSSNDTTVLPRAMELIRDSQLTVWGGDLIADNTESCSHENINCTLTTYHDAEGNPLVKTMLYDGLDAKTATYGKGHYWTGDDELQDKWAKAQGPSASQAIWAFFENITLDGVNQIDCSNDSLAPNTPTGLASVTIYDKYAELSIDANSETDLKGYKIYNNDGSALTSSAVTTELITISGLSTETSYQVYATAIDQCGNESTPSSLINFTTRALAYIAPTAVATCTEHYNSARLDTNAYLACGSANGYINDVTLWQKQDGTWTSENLNGDNTGGGDDGGNVTPGSWSSNSSLAGMEVHLYTPTSTTANGKRALMITLHGCAQSNEIVRDSWGWQDQADEYGMVIAAPMAPNGGVIAGCWDYYGKDHSATSSDKHDDNLTDLANNLLADNSLNIDADQVYLSGLSSGGGQTFVMACLAPEIFAGIGINAGPAVGTSSGQIGSVAVNATQAKNTCLSFADNNNQSAFQTQLTSVVHGNNDTTVATGYAEVDAQAMALIYGATKDAASSSISGGGTQETWSDDNGVRIQKIMVSGLGHAWPAGSDSTGGSYTDHSSIDYPAELSAFFFENNRRADIAVPDDVTPPNVPTNLTVTNTNANSVTLAWNAVADIDLSHYTLYQDSNFYSQVATTSANITNLLAETSYNFTVSATDNAGNESSMSGVVTATTQPVDNSDTVKPVISLLGNDTINLIQGDSFIDPGATANDNIDGNISANIIVSGTVNTSQTGTYLLSYDVQDAAGNNADTLMRSIIVTAAITCSESTASNYAHVQAGRATTNGIYAFTVGSGENMGLYNLFYTSTLAETSENYFVIGNCP